MNSFSVQGQRQKDVIGLLEGVGDAAPERPVASWKGFGQEAGMNAMSFSLLIPFSRGFPFSVLISPQKCAGFKMLREGRLQTRK